MNHCEWENFYHLSCELRSCTGRCGAIEELLCCPYRINPSIYKRLAADSRYSAIGVMLHSGLLSLLPGMKQLPSNQRNPVVRQFPITAQTGMWNTSDCAVTRQQEPRMPRGCTRLCEVVLVQDRTSIGRYIIRFSTRHWGRREWRGAREATANEWAETQQAGTEQE